ncbi:MAG: TolC family protein [Candidatus Marinimicrobia bacterium]|nr:TolC family protein [Candidatus Neomarinimicrobiota bacterium]
MTTKYFILSLFLTLLVSTGLYSENLLTLEQCIQIAKAKNVTLLQSGYSLESSRINTRDAYSALYPGASFSISSGAGSSDFIPSENGSFSHTTSISQTLYTPGLLPGLKMAKLSEKKMEAALNATQNQLETAVATLYYNILSAKALILVYEENIRLADENIKKIRTMYELGTRTESDVLKSEVQKGNFVSQLINEQQNLLALKRNLNVTLGRSANQDLNLANTGTEAATLLKLEDAFIQLRKNNPDLKQAEMQKELSQLSLSAAKQGYYPNVSASYNYTSSSSDGTSISGSSVSLNAGMSLFNRFKTKNTIQKERIKLKQSDLSYDDNLRNLDRRLLDLYTQNLTIDELIGINETTLESSQRDLDIVTQQYQIGSSTILDQMNAQLSVLNAQSNLVKLKYSKKILESQITTLIGL